MSHDLHCPACGSLLADTVLGAKFAELQETVTALGIEVQRKQKTITNLRKAELSDHPPELDDAMEVAQFWKTELMPSARELNGPRLTNTIDRLRHGYDKASLKLSLWGYRCKPNVAQYGKRVRHDQGGKRSVDLKDLMRDASAVDKGIEIAEEERHHEQQLLDAGASRYVAALCDCGHPRADHALYRVHGHDQCLARDCMCVAFDDLGHQVSYRNARLDRYGTVQERLL